MRLVSYIQIYYKWLQMFDSNLFAIHPNLSIFPNSSNKSIKYVKCFRSLQLLTKCPNCCQVSDALLYCLVVTIIQKLNTSIITARTQLSAIILSAPFAIKKVRDDVFLPFEIKCICRTFVSSLLCMYIMNKLPPRVIGLSVAMNVKCNTCLFWINELCISTNMFNWICVWVLLMFIFMKWRWQAFFE